MNYPINTVLNFIKLHKVACAIAGVALVIIVIVFLSR